VPRALLRYALLAAALYTVYAVAVFFLQRSMLFAGRRRGPKPAPGELASGIERVWLPIAEGRVEAYYLRPPEGSALPAPALLFAHGNAELIDDWPDLLEELRTLGLALLLVEYPGYGRSDGEPTERSVRETMEVAFDWLAARAEVDRQRIIGYGRSLGGGAICTLVGRRPLAALVLQSTFTGVRSFAAGMLLPGVLVRDPFDNLAAVARFQGPVLVVHGSRDEVIAYAHGQRLAAAVKRGRLRTYDSMHNDCPPDWDAFRDDLRSFLVEHRLLAPD